MAGDEDCWGVFGDDDDDSSASDDGGARNETALDSANGPSASISAAAKDIALFLTKSFLHDDSSIQLHHRLIHCHDDQDQKKGETEFDANEWQSQISQKLKARGMALSSKTRDHKLERTDTTILFCTSANTDLAGYADALRAVVPGGWALFYHQGSNFDFDACDILDEALWDVENTSDIFSTDDDINVCTKVWAIRKREGLLNSLSCTWKTGSHGTKEGRLYERSVISDTTVGRSAYERSFPHYHSNSMTVHSKRKAIHALQKYGFCVIRDIVPTTDVQEWREAVLSDMDAAIQVLSKDRNVNLLEPGKTGADPVSYRELAMREDLRVDLRYGPSMKRLRHQQRHQQQGDSDNSNNTIRNHPALLEVAQSAMNPKGEHFSGNFGRWNFGGHGPDGTPQPMTVGEIAAVISCRGCADQAIHADTPHLFEHMNCLPPHYINLFFPAVDHTLTTQSGEEGAITMEFNGDTPVGGTAFVAESHKLDVCERLMDDDNRQERLRRITRPSLNMGDALLFDCRVLHFGLANNSSCPTSSNDNANSDENIDGRRPLLYMNLTHSWFSDPKNWDDRERLFPVLD
jgi:hypothetical protein